ncbi:MAG: RusA family crossover junction endodeoxyribonuclease [Chloroflexi bacterium]|nr:RusA family crossover junction endodeoxyribonuclease [Chloroflexota bacterium]
MSGALVLDLPWRALAPDNERLVPVRSRGSVRQVPSTRYSKAKALARSEILVQTRGRGGIAGPVRVDVVVRFPDRNVRDVTNYAKMVCDALCGLAIETDRWTVLRETSWTAAGVDAENPGATVTITPLRGGTMVEATKEATRAEDGYQAPERREDEGEALTLTTLKGGAAVAMFDEALAKVLDNVKDERTGARARKVVLTVSVAPDEVEGLILRDTPHVAIEVDAKLAPITTGESPHRIVGRRGAYQLRLGL